MEDGLVHGGTIPSPNPEPIPLCRILGYPADELTTKSFQDTTHTDDLAASVVRVEQIRDGKFDRYDADKRYLPVRAAQVLRFKENDFRYIIWLQSATPAKNG